MFINPEKRTSESSFFKMGIFRPYSQQRKHKYFDMFGAFCRSVGGEEP